MDSHTWGDRYYILILIFVVLLLLFLDALHRTILLPMGFIPWLDSWQHQLNIMGCAALAFYYLLVSIPSVVDAFLYSFVLFTPTDTNPLTYLFYSIPGCTRSYSQYKSIS